jgi:hypothetical protein
MAVASHVAAAHQEPAAAGGISDELSNPPNGLRFYFGGERREPECADILVDHRREKIAKRSEGGRTRRDVTKEVRMAVEQRMLEQQTGGLSEHLCRSLARVRKPAFALERATDFCNRLVSSHKPMRHRRQPVGQRINELMAECTKVVWGFERVMGRSLAGRSNRNWGPSLMTVRLWADFRFAHCAPISFGPCCPAGNNPLPHLTRLCTRLSKWRAQREVFEWERGRLPGGTAEQKLGVPL